MAIFTRIEFENFPGAITIAELPYLCTAHPTIQGLGRALMSAFHNKPSTIIGGIIYTEAGLSYVLFNVCLNP